MSSMFDSKVAEERRRTPWFCRASVLEWMKAHAGESSIGDNVTLTVAYRPSVASRFWYGLEFTDESGQRRLMTAQETELLTWRAEIANTFKHPFLAANKLPKLRRWRFRLFGWRVTFER